MDAFCSIHKSAFYLRNLHLGNGFFLYSATEVEKTDKARCTDNDKLNITITIQGNDSFDVDDDDEDGLVEIYEEGTPVQIIVSFWYWW